MEMLKFIMPKLYTKKLDLFLTICLIIFIGFISSKCNAREIFNVSDPGRLVNLLDESDYIVVAKCEKDQSAERGALRILDFTIVEQIKGENMLKNLSMGLNPRYYPYEILYDGKPVLLFLRHENNRFYPVQPSSCFQIKAPNLDIAAKVKEYIRINSFSDVNRRVLLKREYIFNNLVSVGDSFIKENVAEDLWEIIQNSKLFKLTEKDVDIIVNAILNSQSYKITQPLCLVLDVSGSEKVVEACLHSLLKTESLFRDVNYRLAPIVAKRKALATGLIKEAFNEQNSRRIWAIITQLYMTPDKEFVHLMEKLWHANRVSRPLIRDLLGRSSSSDERKALLNKLSSEN